ncbi:hypothetical protein Pmar_PMAR007386, partial [Perkinsus marinus ATCC 50983]
MSEFDTYAAGTITPVLSRALADLYQQEHGSVEPVEYLSNWLKLWAEAQVSEQEREVKARKQLQYTKTVDAE